MHRVKEKKYVKLVALIIMFSLIAPLGAGASNSLYQDVKDKLWETYGEGIIEAGGFAIEPTTKKPTESFEAFMQDDKLVELYADVSSTFAAPTSTKSYRTVAYQYWVTPSKEHLNDIPAYTKPLDYLSAQQAFMEVVKATDAYQRGFNTLNTRITIPRATLEAELGSWVDTTPYLYQTAIVQIYNPQTGQVLDEFNIGLFDTTDLGGQNILGLDRLKAKATSHGFGASIGDEWYTRSKFIPLNPIDAPDFTPIPEKHLYQGNPGEEVTITVDLVNLGTAGETVTIPA